MDDQTLRPFLRWAGSKRQLLPVLKGYLSPSYRRYLEPFVGSGSLFFYLQPPNAILGDINSELINTYVQVKENFIGILQSLSKMRAGKEEYYRVRALDLGSLSSAERAARFIYLNRNCFNGLYRTNRSGHFNVPYGGDKTGKIPDHRMLESCSNILQSTSLISGDFEMVLSHARPGDFVYLDPPYMVRERRVFNEYNPVAFNEDDLKRLRKWLNQLTDIGSTFLLSYAECDDVKMLMEDYPAKQMRVRRNIAGFSGNRRISREWLISNKELLHIRNQHATR